MEKTSRMFPIQTQRGAKPHPLLIPWSVAELAYSVYAAEYGRGQSLERLAQRGGFGPGEMDSFLPDWRERCAAIDVVLFCPVCRKLHVDVPDPARGWTNPPHRSHLCRPEDGGCGCIWRPADVPTNGVAEATTRGVADTWPGPVPGAGHDGAE